MAKGYVKVKTNVEEGVDASNELEKELKDAADNAASALARQWIREARRTLTKNGNVVTGQGKRSLRTTGATETGKEAVEGAAYLLDLDTGTQPHWPDGDSYRFRAAARQYGMDRMELAQIIARQGTKPHPWIRETTSRFRKSVGERLDVHVSDAVQEASKEV